MVSSYMYSESRPSRRSDTYPHPRDEDYLKPTTGTSERRRRSGERAAEGQTKSSSRQPSPYRSSRKDDRYDYSDYPPPVPPDSGRPSRHPRSRSRRRHTWPPQPTVEDEATSLAKEAGTQSLLRSVGRDEARSRGKVNQEPIIEDVPEYTKKDERRPVQTPPNNGSSKPKGDLPTPPTSEDEKARKARRRPSKLDMSFKKVDESVPEMNKRPASPYSFKPSRESKEESSNNRYLSPESLLSPPPTDPRSRVKRGQPESRSQPSSPRRERGKYSPSSRTGDDYFSLSNESAIDDREDDRNRPATYPPSRDRDVPNKSPQTAVVDFAPVPSAVPVRKAMLDSRRNTDSQSTLPTMQKLRNEKNRRPTPLMASSALSDLEGARFSESPSTLQPPIGFPSSRREPGYSSRAVSPTGSVISNTSAVSATEPSGRQRSPRASAEFLSNRSAEHSPITSRNGSISGSVSGSRPSSPSPRTPGDSPRLPRTDLDWSALMALNAARRPKAGSRLSTELRQESMPVMPCERPRQVTPRLDSLPPLPASRTESLPYPMDEGPWTPTAYMPSERTRQYFPDMKPSAPPQPMQDSQFLSTSASSVSNNSYLSSTGSSRPARPSISSRHSTADLPQTEKRSQLDRPKPSDTSRSTADSSQTEKRSHLDRPKLSESSRRTSFNSSSQIKNDLKVLVKRGLPACTRTVPVANYNDWYTLLGAPTLNFCPDCIDTMFEKTAFRNYFRRSPPINYNTKVHCALGGQPWIRLAYLISMQQQRSDLSLLKEIAEIEDHSDLCPGHAERVRSWYGIRDSDGIFVKNFYVCYTDVRKIEALLPTLNGLFVRHPNRVSEENHLCAIRSDGNRFGTYIDELISAHEKARETRKGVDSTNFIETVKRRQRLRECTRDNLLSNGLWHFIPTLPEFTVCEDCYESNIEPHVKKNNDLAMRFHRTLQPAYGEGIGSSCQLYSTRMRLVFNEAIKYKDFKYLTRKAKERREAEIKLQERYREVMRKYKRLSWDGERLSESEERGLDRQLAEIGAEWNLKWE